MNETPMSPDGMPGPLVSTTWLADNLGAPDMRVLDCSVVMRTTDDGGYTFVGGEDEWRAGHVPGSAFVDVLQQLADASQPFPMMLPPAEEFAATMEALGIGEGTRVVLYDRSNHAWAARVWWMLRTYGFDAAAVLNGGWNKWVAEDRPQSVEPPGHAPARFEVRMRPELMATKARVVEAVDAGDVTLINALSPEEHTGATSRFPRAGRIPGSVNVFCQHLVSGETHEYLPVDELRQKFAAAGADPAKPAITYCGAGNAASSDALALAVLGFENIAVYDGSLSEWTADADLPMETG